MTDCRCLTWGNLDDRALPCPRPDHNAQAVIVRCLNCARQCRSRDRRCRCRHQYARLQ